MTNVRAGGPPSILADPVCVVAPDLPQQRLDGGQRRGHARIQWQHNHVEELRAAGHQDTRLCHPCSEAEHATPRIVVTSTSWMGYGMQYIDTFT